MTSAPAGTASGMSFLSRLKSWLKPVDGIVGAPSGGPHPLPRDEPGTRRAEPHAPGRPTDGTADEGGAHRA